MNYKIDNLQYCKWSREVFEINREAGLDAVHVTVVYHEDFQEFKNRIDEWNLHFKNNSDLILLGKTYKDIEIAKKENKTAIFFGLIGSNNEAGIDWHNHTSYWDKKSSGISTKGTGTGASKSRASGMQQP